MQRVVPSPLSSPLPPSPPTVNVLVVGIVVQDVVFFVDHYPGADESIRALDQQKRLGGNATNSVCVLAQLARCTPPNHLPFTVAPSLGASLGSSITCSRIVDQLHSAYQVDVLPCLFNESHSLPTSFIIVSLRTSSRAIIHHRGTLPELPATYMTDLWKQRRDQQQIHSGNGACPIFQLIHFEGRSNVPELSQMMNFLLTQKPASPHPHPLPILASAVLQSICVSMEIEKPRPDILTLVPLVNILFLSHEYASTLVPNCDSPLRFLDILTNHSSPSILPVLPNQIVVVMWGEQGAAVRTETGMLLSAAAERVMHVVDSVGAGDTFIGSFLYGVLCMRRHLLSRRSSPVDHHIATGWYQQILLFACLIAAEKCRTQGIDLNASKCQQCIDDELVLAEGW